MMTSSVSDTLLTHYKVTTKEFEQELEAALEDYRERDAESKMEIERLSGEVRELRRGAD